MAPTTITSTTTTSVQGEISTVQEQKLYERLMNKFNGDVERVEARMKCRKAKIAKRTQQTAPAPTPTPTAVVEQPPAQQVKEKKMNPKMEELKNKYATELAQLEQQGIHRPLLCLRLLNKFDGDVEQVSTIINKKQAKRQPPAQTTPTTRPKKMNPKMEELKNKYATELAQLELQGIHRPLLCLRLLNKFDGDVEQVSTVINKKQDKHQPPAQTTTTPTTTTKKMNPKMEELKNKYATELSQLEQQGIHRPQLCLRLLSKFDGDVEQVSTVINKKQAKRQPPAETTTTTTTTTTPTTTKKMNPKMEELKNKYSNELAQLEQQGIHRPVLCLRLLNKFDGDVEQVSTVINKKQDKCAQRQANMEELKNKYSNELAQLEQQGIHRPLLCLRLLNKFDGDVEQVATFISNKQAKKQAKHQSSLQELTTKYSTELAQLQEQGHHCSNVCLRLLNKFDGDVGQVSTILSKKQAKKQARHQSSLPQLKIKYASELAQLEARGIHRSMLCVRLLDKFDGDVERVANVVQRTRAIDQQTHRCARQTGSSPVQPPKPKKMNPKMEELKNKYSTELVQLEQQGIHRPNLCLRLLNKFDGDVERVSTVVNKKLAKH